MSAREMFEKLGYEKVSNNCSDSFWYRKDNYYDIWFNYYEKTISVEEDIDIKLFKAIQQQIKELGWEE